jgi:hypothetical protein
MEQRMDDNLFDEDDALDYILYKECEKESKNSNGKSGCAGVLVLLIAPAVAFVLVRFI